MKQQHPSALSGGSSAHNLAVLSILTGGLVQFSMYTDES